MDDPSLAQAGLWVVDACQFAQQVPLGAACTSLVQVAGLSAHDCSLHHGSLFFFFFFWDKIDDGICSESVCVFVLVEL